MSERGRKIAKGRDRKDLTLRRRAKAGNVDRMLGTECRTIHIKRIGRHEIRFSNHALATWLTRVDYHPTTEMHGVNELAKLLDRGCAYVREAPPAVLPLSLWSHARNVGYVTVDGGCFPVQRNPRGELVAPTYLSYRGGE